MHNHKHTGLDFLKKKIKEIKIGLFRSETNSELRLPNNIIQVLRIEDDGSIWFFTSCTHKQAENVEKTFYACLDFHKRGTDCRLQLRGIATIAEKDSDLFSMSSYSEGTAERLLLVKMKIMQAEYFESNPLTNVNSLGEKIRSIFNNMFLNNEPKIYNFS